MSEWIRANPAILAALFGLSLVLFLGSLIVMPLIVARMSSDYFVRRRPSEESWRGRHVVLRYVFLAVKNFLGAVLLLAGISMLVLPGQGVITIFVGMSLLDFPGKRRLELRIVRQRHVLQAINWIRTRADRPPLEIPPRRTGTRAGDPGEPV